MSYSYDALLDELERDEALRLKVYDDATGKPLQAGDTLRGKLTAGIARNLSDVGLSPAESRMLCGNDIATAEKGLSAVVPYWRGLSDNRQRVLLNMTFNLGAAGLAKFTHMLAAIAAGDFAKAAAEMLDSHWAKQVGDRAQRLAEMMRRG